MSLKLHLHPLASYCHKVLIALYENDTPFIAEIVNLGDPNAKARFTQLWPTAKIPLLEDQQNNRVVPETSIIIEYLDRNFPGRTPLLPTSADACLEARLWDRMFDLYVMAPMQQIVANRLRPEKERDQRGVDEATAALLSAYEMIERHMTQRRWAIGDAFSIADCAAAPALFYSSIIVPFPSALTQLAAYFERLIARPSVARTINEAKPYFQYFPFIESMPARFLT
jgi:glutathione S-transferase